MTQGPGLGSPRNICVFRALQLGDMVCATPALRALRRRFGSACVTLVGLPWASHFAARMSDCIDDFEAFPGWPGLPEQKVDEARLPHFLQAMRERRFDLAVQLHGSGRLSNAVVESFGAKRVVGHRPADESQCAEAGASARVGVEQAPCRDYWPYPELLHEVHRNLHLMGRIGAPIDDDNVSFPLLDSDRAELRRRRPDLAALTPHGFVCLHPGARDPAKWWPAASFAVVGDALAAMGWKVVLTGSGSEHGLCDEVADRMKSPALNAACDISVGALACVMSGARLMVSNDTGVAHVAAGLGLPSVVVFTATDPRRWAPLDSTRHIALHGAHTIDPPSVIAAAQRLLSRSLPAAAA